MFLRAKMPCCFGLLALIALPLGAGSQGGVAANGSSAVQRPPAYSATLWTTISHPLPDGSTSSITQRAEVHRDAQGQWQSAYYRPTNGPQYDASAPLAHIVSGTTTSAAKTLAPSISSGETLEQDEDLGTRIEGGLQTQGRRRTFLSVDKPQSAKHVLETWYSPELGVVVHTVSHNFDGSSFVSDLTQLQVGKSALPIQTQSSREGAATATQIPNRLRLYRALFNIVAQMERARLAASPTHKEDMVAVEDSLRKDVNLSKSEWQTLVTTALKVDAYTAQIDQQARTFARQARAANLQRPDPTNSLSATRAELQKMESDQDARLLADVEEFEARLGARATMSIRSYLNGPLAASALVTTVQPPSKGTR